MKSLTRPCVHKGTYDEVHDGSEEDEEEEELKADNPLNSGHVHHWRDGENASTGI